MSDLLELLKDFEELSKKYNVTKIEEQQDIWSSSPYFYSGGVSTMGSSGTWTWDDKAKPVYPTYGYERYTWKDSVEDDD